MTQTDEKMVWLTAAESCTMGAGGESIISEYLEIASQIARYHYEK